HLVPQSWLVFFSYCSADHRDLPSFPTRRSSDLPATFACHVQPPGLNTRLWAARGNDARQNPLDARGFLPHYWIRLMEPLRFGHTLGCFEDLSAHLDAHPVRQRASPFEWGLRWDTPSTQGTVNHVQVRPGLGVVALDLVQFQPWSLDVVHEAIGIEIGFHR